MCWKNVLFFGIIINNTCEKGRISYDENFKDPRFHQRKHHKTVDPFCFAAVFIEPDAGLLQHGGYGCRGTRDGKRRSFRRFRRR